MQITTPLRPVGGAVIQGEDPKIAYAFIRYPEQFNHLAHSILTNALRAGVLHRAWRGQIEPMDWFGYFTNYFSVGFFNVHRNKVSWAVDALVEAFEDLKLPGFYIIAVLSADDVYVPVRGITGVDFEGAFMKKETMEHYLVKAMERQTQHEQVLDIVRDWIEQNLPKSKSAPPDPDQGAAQ